MKTLARLFLACALLLGIAVTTVHAAAADDLSAIKARMTARISAIDTLKAAEENKDRTVVYAALAKQTNSTADQVAKTRAKQIAANSAKGVWVQDDKGAWAKK
jgi:uncharacterized protein YdbL (DUF1318 family)